MDGSLRVLLVEDDSDFANLVEKRLRHFNPNFEVETISSGDSCLQRISRYNTDYEAIILDYQLPQFDGLDILRTFESNGVDTPVVMVSGKGSEKVAVEALKKGACDYLIKDASFLAVLPGVVQRTIEKHQLEVRLRESERKYQNMFDSISDIIYQVNRDFEIISANKAFRTSSRFDTEELTGQKCYEVFFNRDEPCRDCPAKSTFETSRSGSDEKCKDDELFALKSYPLHNLHGEIESVTVYAKNITEKRNLERSLIQSEKLVTIGLLASGVAHEIRNPLNIIETARYYLTEFLADQHPETKDKLRIIGKNVRRASKIISNLLEFSRNSQHEQENINLNRLIESTVSLIGKELTAKNVEFVLKSDADYIAYFSIDSLKQVLLNIIINSVQAMPEGGHLTVEIAPNSSDGLDVRISDTGVGISKENLSHIFSPFFTTKEVGVGTGLGLYITHMIIERDGGRITVNSKVDEGTTFTIWLPKPRSEVMDECGSPTCTPN